MIYNIKIGTNSNKVCKIFMNYDLWFMIYELRFMTGSWWELSRIIMSEIKKEWMRLITHPLLIYNKVYNIIPHKSEIINQNIRNNIGTTTPIRNRIPPLPQNPFEPFTMTRPVSVINTSETANTSLKIVHHLPGL